MIAHQWRQPLAAISSTSIGINLKATLGTLNNESAIELSGKISSYAQHLSSTIDDFREFFKSNKEKRETTYDELLKNVLDIIETSIVNKNIKITQDLNCNIKFSTYSNEMKQVILNLIKNAEDALIETKANNPTINISTFEENNQLIMEVSDNAGGITPEIIDNIFDPYFSTKKEKNGTGLGLYMSKTIIEEHIYGKLSVLNNKDGAVFRIALKKDN